MSLEIVSVGSSSSGNSYIIRTCSRKTDVYGREAAFSSQNDSAAVPRTMILDAGLPCRTIMAALDELGITPEEVDAVLITHEHTDHVKSVRAVARKCSNAIFYTSRGTFEHTPNFAYVPGERVRFVSAGDVIPLDSPASGSVQAKAAQADAAADPHPQTEAARADSGADPAGPAGIGVFALSHDAAEPVGYTITAGGEKLAVVTDTGVITDEIYDAIQDADMLVFEANHDAGMLMYGEYPYPLKMRIKGDFGHLSNDYAGEILVRIITDRQRRNGSMAENSVISPLRIMLAHLSFHNNMPLFARQTIEEHLAAADLDSGRDYLLEVASKEGLTCMPDADRNNA